MAAGAAPAAMAARASAAPVQASSLLVARRMDTVGNGRRVMCLQAYFLAAITFTEPLTVCLALPASAVTVKR